MSESQFASEMVRLEVISMSMDVIKDKSNFGVERLKFLLAWFLRYLALLKINRFILQVLIIIQFFIWIVGFMLLCPGCEVKILGSLCYVQL